MGAETEQATRDIGNNYAEFLEAMKSLSGYSQRELANFIGLSHGSISNYIRGGRLSGNARLLIADAFGLSPDESTRLAGGIPLGHKAAYAERHMEREQIDFRQALGQALLERIATGHPLGEREELLVRELGGIAIPEESTNPTP